MVARAGVLWHSVIRAELACGGPGRSPTCDLRVRSAPLYASELPGRSGTVYREGTQDFELAHAGCGAPVGPRLHHISVDVFTRGLAWGV
jgi:hypothetical protein